MKKNCLKYIIRFVFFAFIVLLLFSFYIVCNDPSAANWCAMLSIILGLILSAVLDCQQGLINKQFQGDIDKHEDKIETLKNTTEELSEDVEEAKNAVTWEVIGPEDKG